MKPVCVIPKNELEEINKELLLIHRKTVGSDFPDWECKHWLRWSLVFWGKLEKKYLPDSNYNFWDYYIRKDGEVYHK